ncbi:MAG: uroporphyrinogen-III synthase [Flavobacteriales bacterium]|jgi:uroporphyrinogen-III synthase
MSEGKIKTILISQPRPVTEKSPYFELATKHNLKIDFRSFIHVEPIDAQEFRQERISIMEHTAVILTSKYAVNHFFRMCEEMRVTVPDSMKYFCISESVAFYLQHHIVYRKRKIFVGKVRFSELIEMIKKHKQEKFLLPCSNLLKSTIPESLETAKINYTKAVMYKTVCSDLSDLAEVKYDMLVFFSPSGIESLLKNFPDFSQGTTKIAAFGPTTLSAVEEAGFRCDVNAPHPKAPSMSMAIEQYIHA